MATEAPKNWWLSKLNWLGIITFAISMLQFATQSDFVKDNPQVVAIIGAVVGGLTVVLRYFTTKPVAPPTIPPGGDTTPKPPSNGPY